MQIAVMVFWSTPKFYRDLRYWFLNAQYENRTLSINFIGLEVGIRFKLNG